MRLAFKVVSQPAVLAVVVGGWDGCRVGWGRGGKLGGQGKDSDRNRAGVDSHLSVVVFLQGNTTFQRIFYLIEG